jgi:predicted fused transcriptional regulator/phosphomethylpyrimidine kinase
MNDIKYDDHIVIKPKDKIHLILYYDHATTQESIEEIRKKPPLLWCVGKIINLHTDDPFYVVLNTGSVGGYIKPNWKDIIMRNAIKSMEVIYSIPEDFEQES